MSTQDTRRPQWRTDGKPSLFFGEREYKFFNDISQELIEVVVKQKVKYYAIEEKLTQYHDLYGESKQKVFRTPVELYGRILYNEPTILTGEFMDRNFSIDIYFQKEVLWRDLGMNPRVGDYIQWDGDFFEIHAVIEPQIIAGLPEFKFAIICNCQSSRQGTFDPTLQGISDISFDTNERETRR